MNLPSKTLRIILFTNVPNPCTFPVGRPHSDWGQWVGDVGRAANRCWASCLHGNGHAPAPSRLFCSPHSCSVHGQVHTCRPQEHRTPTCARFGARASSQSRFHYNIDGEFSSTCNLTRQSLIGIWNTFVFRYITIASKKLVVTHFNWIFPHFVGCFFSKTRWLIYMTTKVTSVSEQYASG